MQIRHREKIRSWAQFALCSLVSGGVLALATKHMSMTALEWFNSKRPVGLVPLAEYFWSYFFVGVLVYFNVTFQPQKGALRQAMKLTAIGFFVEYAIHGTFSLVQCAQNPDFAQRCDPSGYLVWGLFYMFLAAITSSPAIVWILCILGTTVSVNYLLLSWQFKNAARGSVSK